MKTNSIRFKETAWKASLVLIFSLSIVILYFPFWNNSIYAKHVFWAVFAFGLLLLLILRKPFDWIYLNLNITFLSIYFLVQSLYLRSFQQYGQIATAISMFTQVGAVTSSIVEFLKLSDIIFLIVPISSLLFSWCLSRHAYSRDASTKKILFIFSVVLLAFTSFQSYEYFSEVEHSKNAYETFLYYKTDHYIYTVVPSTNQFVEKFGLVGWLLRDSEKTFLDPVFDNNTEENDAITTLLQSRQAPNSTKYSGIFKGKSLFVIEAESLNNFAIDPVLTPTLYRLYVDGMVATNYNSPLLFGSTSDAEFMANTGLVPANDGYVTFHKYYMNTFPQTLAKTFNEQNYYSIAFHNNYGEFYNRNIVFPLLGYNFYDCIDMGFKEQFIDDSKYLDVLTWIMVEKEKFLSYWITFNGHQPYGMSELKDDMIGYYDEIGKVYPDLPSNERVYLAKNMDLDKGLANLLEVFTYSHRLDDLVIVLFGDHQPKGAFEDKEIFYPYCDLKNLDRETCLNTPLIIWNNDAFVGRIDTVASPIDISPTIFDLFGITFNNKLMLGHNIFDTSNEGFYFNANGLIRTNTITYDPIKKELTNTGDLSNEEALNKAQELYRKLNLSYKIVENNYFATQQYKDSILP